MTPTQPLMADAVVGTDVSKCLVLASHPGERMGPQPGKPSLTRRTLVLFCDGQKACYAMTLPDPLLRAWTSDTGTGYAAPVRGSYIYVYDKGRWKREEFSDKDEQITYIWGLSGQGETATDTVYMSTYSGLFIRQAGTWTLQVPPPPAQKVYGVHGLTPSEIHVCSDEGPLLWNGSAFEAAEPPPGPLAKWVLVRPDEIICGGDILTRWTPIDGWQRTDPPVADVMALAQSEDQLLIATYEKGIFEERGGSFTQVTPDFKCMALQPLHNGAFVRDKQQGWMKTGGAWHPLTMPMCAIDGQPTDPA